MVQKPRFYRRKDMIRISLVGSDRYENRMEIKDLVFKLKNTYGDNLILIMRGNQNGVEKWVKKWALEMGVKYIEYNSASTPMNLYSGMNESYYDKPYHPTQKLPQYELIARNSDKIIYFGEISHMELSHFKKMLKISGSKATFVG